MENLIKKAYAKINLTLEILEKREDGYHNIKSIMQKISLHDLLTFGFNESGEIFLECSKDVCDMKDNLAYKAAEKFQALYKEKCNKTFGVSIYIDKHIPDKAGLAGGSADCACVLDTLYEKFGVVTYDEVEKIASSLGSDINFCLDKYRCALCTDRGIKLEKCVPYDFQNILVCVPDFGMKTPEIYKSFDENPILFDNEPTYAVKNALESKNADVIYENIVNSFESICEKQCSDITYIKETMLSFGAKASRMSGSGSSVFGIFEDEDKMYQCMDVLKESYGNCFDCCSVIE